ncbi:hypothetical protein Micbo1qcDRAFT_200031 [Microdochium bolleyi]|uniref:Myb-like domain-containing protein n=1 Tax=Microdochium bolleyi TaxID=196109 RepID=A0A136JJK2_9PEZI|nr:hypothetical protein Micbo1qcDRAFT_200031 [Microdochium bolleyi]
MSSSTSKYSAKDMDILVAAWKTSKVDWQALAELGLYKNAQSARASFDAFKRRVFGADYNPGSQTGAAGSTDAAPGSAQKKPATPRKRKGKAAEPSPAQAVGDVADDEPESSIKKVKKDVVEHEKSEEEE